MPVHVATYPTQPSRTARSAVGPAQLSSARLSSARLSSARLSSARLSSARLGSARLGLARLGPARLGPARLGSARLGSARPGSARPGSARLGLARLGPARLGSVWLGSARLGSARHRCLSCSRRRLRAPPWPSDCGCLRGLRCRLPDSGRRRRGSRRCRPSVQRCLCGPPAGSGRRPVGWRRGWWAGARPPPYGARHG
ncbi:pentapeptide repeat-containing protein [Actinoplanes sp. NPDC051411]|uniref:pentapeptide repeat-containing protein n=1 Tax=Actinoplanes sp. NPDC051411 TaxID=3155522 RepID=UPI0034386DF7